MSDVYFALRKRISGEDLFLVRYSEIAGTNVHDAVTYGFRSTGFAFYDNHADMALINGYLSLLDIASVIDRGSTVLMGDDELVRAYDLLQRYFFALSNFAAFPNGELPSQEEMMRLDVMQEKLFEMVKFGVKGMHFSTLLSQSMKTQTGAQIARQLLNPVQQQVYNGQRQLIDNRVGLADLISPEILGRAPTESTEIQELDNRTYLPPGPVKVKFT